jgi:membrane protease YdiL (CAAX protease family)
VSLQVTLIGFHLAFLFFLLKQDCFTDTTSLFRLHLWKARDAVLAVLMHTGFVSALLIARESPSVNTVMSHNLPILGTVFFLCLLAFFKYGLGQKVTALGLKWNAFSKGYMAVLLMGSLVLALLMTVPPVLFKLRTLAVALGLLGESIPPAAALSALDDTSRVFYLCLVAPAVEETLFRGIAYAPFRRKYGPTKAVVITALLFFTSHPNLNITSLFYGLLFGWLYERTQSLPIIVAGHGVLNGLLIILSLRLGQGVP